MNDRSINESDRNKSCNENIHRLDISTKQQVPGFKPSESQLLTWVMTRWVKYSVPVASQAESDSCVGIDTNQNDSYN